jgi:hypothetical protein
MKMAEFYNVLSKLKRKWVIGCNQDIRTQTRTGIAMCPVTAVAYKVTGKLYNTRDYNSAGKAINISRRSIMAVVYAADSTNKEYQRTRRKLLKAVGLG